VAIELDLSAGEIEDICQEFWVLNQLEELACMFMEIKNDLTPFVKLFKLLKRQPTEI